MKTSDGGKGDAPRKQQDQKAYEEGWDRIFRKNVQNEEPLGKAIKDEPLEEHDND